MLISDQYGQNENLRIYKGFLNDTNKTPLYENDATNGHSFIKRLSPPVFLQQLEIRSTSVLTICELELFEIGKYFLIWIMILESFFFFFFLCMVDW